MITEGSLELISKMADNRGVVGFWYPNTLTFVFILLGLAVVAILSVIGLFTVLKWLFTRKRKKY